MRFFLDTADTEEIAQGLDWGMVDGVTTNPSLIAKEGLPYLGTVKKIAEMVGEDRPVSGEVLATDFTTMMEEARRLAGLASNVVVKVPLGPVGLKAVRTLRQEGTLCNVTLCFSPTQALLAAKAGAAYISPFVGRVDDISSDGMLLIEQIVEIYGNYDFETEILVASVRHPGHVAESAMMGADVATIPLKILKQLYKHPLTDLGLERFLADWAKTGKSFDD